MRKNKTYHITLPDTIIDEIEELRKMDTLFQSRSAVIAYAVRQLYTDRMAKKVDRVSRGKVQRTDTP